MVGWLDLDLCSMNDKNGGLLVRCCDYALFDEKSVLTSITSFIRFLDRSLHFSRQFPHNRKQAFFPFVSLIILLLRCVSALDLVPV